MTDPDYDLSPADALVATQAALRELESRRTDWPVTHRGLRRQRRNFSCKPLPGAEISKAIAPKLAGSAGEPAAPGSDSPWKVS